MSSLYLSITVSGHISLLSFKLYLSFCQIVNLSHDCLLILNLKMLLSVRQQITETVSRPQTLTLGILLPSRSFPAKSVETRHLDITMESRLVKDARYVKLHL